MQIANYRKIGVNLLLMCTLFAGCREEQANHSAANQPKLFVNAAGVGGLHVVLVGDTNAVDIQASVMADMTRMQTVVEAIARQTGLTRALITLSGNEVTTVNIERTLSNLHVNPGDVVLFYYAGHGGKPADQKARWPRLFLTNDGGSTGPDLDAIFATLTHLGPRFLIVLGDVRNALTTDGSTVPLQFEPGNAATYHRLFVESQGALLAASAHPGEAAMGTDQGGVFTQQFLQALQTGLNAADSNWQMILTQATAVTADLQAPQSRIYQ